MGRLTVLAGAGGLVPEVVEAARASGHDVQIVHFVQRDDLGLAGTVPYDLLDLQRVEDAIKSFRTSLVTLAGAVRISDEVRMKYGQFAGGDGGRPMGDIALSMLSAVIKSRTGAKLVATQDIAPQILAPAGLFAGPPLDKELTKAARFAMKTARSVGALDVGQAVVVTGERVVSVEDIAGTDALLSRIADYRDRGFVAGSRAAPLILAKAAKPKQPLFVDLPAVGPLTVANAERAGVTVIVVEARRTVLIERPALRDAADSAAITIIGL